MANKTDRKRAPNFNFNVSHEGDYVVLASEPLCICGIDVAAPQQVTASSVHQFPGMALRHGYYWSRRSRPQLPLVFTNLCPGWPAAEDAW